MSLILGLAGASGFAGVARAALGEDVASVGTDATALHGAVHVESRQDWMRPGEIRTRRHACARVRESIGKSCSPSAGPDPRHRIFSAGSAAILPIMRSAGSRRSHIPGCAARCASRRPADSSWRRRGTYAPIAAGPTCGDRMPPPGLAPGDLREKRPDHVVPPLSIHVAARRDADERLHRQPPGGERRRVGHSREHHSTGGRRLDSPVPPASINHAYVTVEVCVAGTKTCASIDHVLLDTGSNGLRLVLLRACG